MVCQRRLLWLFAAALALFVLCSCRWRSYSPQVLAAGGSESQLYETAIRVSRNLGYEVIEDDAARGYMCVRPSSGNGAQISGMMAVSITKYETAFCVETSEGQLVVSARGDYVSDGSIHTEIMDEYNSYVDALREALGAEAVQQTAGEPLLEPAPSAVVNEGRVTRSIPLQRLGRLILVGKPTQHPNKVLFVLVLSPNDQYSASCDVRLTVDGELLSIPKPTYKREPRGHRFDIELSIEQLELMTEAKRVAGIVCDNRWALEDAQMSSIGQFLLRFKEERALTTPTPSEEPANDSAGGPELKL